MAACLNPQCSCSTARVVWTRTIVWLIKPHRGTRKRVRRSIRMVICRPAPHGCGQRRRQLVSDLGRVRAPSKEQTLSR